MSSPYQSHRLRILAALCLALTLLSGCAVPKTPRSAPGPANLSSRAHAPSGQLAQIAFAGLPLGFAINEGQAPAPAKFLARGPGYGVLLSPTAATLIWQASGYSRSELRLQLVGANPQPAMQGQSLLPGKVNYLIGNDPARWRTGLATYAEVHVSGVYPGVDLIYHGAQAQMEYDFLVAPGVDPGTIRIRAVGADAVKLDDRGDLALHIHNGWVYQPRPQIYQEVQGRRQMIPGEYLLHRRGEIGFHISAYDQSKPLVIDPVLAYATFLGGSNADLANAIAVDQDGVSTSPGKQPRLILPAQRPSVATVVRGPIVMAPAGTLLWPSSIRTAQHWHILLIWAAPTMMPAMPWPSIPTIERL